MTKFASSGASASQAPPVEPNCTRAEITEIITEVINSLSGELTIGELRLFNEVEKLARFIQTAKREILDIRPDNISAEYIPEATIELDAVVQATARATSEILDRAESLEKIAQGLDSETRNQITESVTAIFEACNFQDITGQRITKVVKTLKYIEDKIDSLVNAFGQEFANMPPPPPPPKPEGDAGLLNGPQLTQNANSQDDIDALLAGLF